MANASKITDFFLRDILTVLFIVNLFNFTKGIPYLGQFLFFVIFAIGLLYFFRLLANNEMTRFGWLLLVFAVIWTIAWALGDKQVFESSSSSFRNTTELLTPTINFCFMYYPFYYWGKYGNITNKYITTFLFLLIGITLVLYISAFQIMMISYNVKYGNSVVYGYVFACMMPMLGLLWKNKTRMFYILFIIAFLLSILSAKRGAMLCSVASFLLLSLFLMRSKQGNHVRFKYILMSVLFVCGAFLLYDQLLESNVNLATKMEATTEGSYNGRDVFYLELWNMWLNTDWLNKLFGIKFMGAVGAVGFDAHNDWLEILIDAGIIEAIVYLLLMVTLWSYPFQNRKWLFSNEVFVLWACAAVWIIKSLVSMGFTVPEARLYIISFAIVSGVVEKRKRISLLKRIKNENFSSRDI